MDRNFNFDNQSYIPTLQSIDAQSEFSVDLPQTQIQNHLMKLFMLSLQNDRLQKIIRQLQTEAQKGQLRTSQFNSQNRQFQFRFDHLEKENQNLLQSNATLKSNLIQLQKVNSQLQIHKNRGAYNQQLEQKNYFLESKVKRLSQEKIEWDSKQKKLQMDLSMKQFDVMKAAQKNKIKALEQELFQEKSKTDVQRKNCQEQQYMLQKYAQEIRALKDQEISTVRKYEQKLDFIKQNTNLKQSQVSVSQEKIVLLSQEMNRLKQEVQYLRKQLNEQRERISQRDEQIRRLSCDVKGYEHQLQNFQRSYHQISQQCERKEHDIIYLQQHTRQVQQKHNSLQQAYREVEYVAKEKSNDDMYKSRENRRLLEDIESLQQQISILRNDNKKLKRKSMIPFECDVCKMNTKKGNISLKKIESSKALQIEEIIRETEKLSQSNRKIQSLISHHEINSQHSIEIKTYK